MRMLERRPCGLAVIFENQNVLKAPVLFQIENAITESPENVFDTLGWQRRQTGIVIGSFNDHYHWHIEFMPKLTKTAGFEWGTGFYINPTPPEEAAKFLREASVEEPVPATVG